MKSVNRWGVFEVTINGPKDGNPFTDKNISGVFESATECVTCTGFYDGDGIYKVRFMPSFEGEYNYKTYGNFEGAQTSGTFVANAPDEGNHGPVGVANTYHFAYADGTPYYSVGTTCYVWCHQSDEVYNKTLAELDKSYFNKMRFCVFPKHYLHNLKDPVTFPYEGTPIDCTLFTEHTVSFDGMQSYEGNNFDFTRFNPEHFRRVERAITDLQSRGIEADIIIMHPYDRWGFSAMNKEQDELYWRYCIARFSAYRNVWWSFANEYDLFRHKTTEDWERYAQIVCEADPYNRLRGIHNCGPFYDHSKAWITHCSLQRQDIYRHVEYTDEYRLKWGKPIVWDEIAYEGNIDQGWGNISGQEITRRFWEGSMRGGYVGHGETYLDPIDDVIWWSHGGELHGDSPARIRFLHDILCETPGHGLKKSPNHWDEICGIPEDDSCSGYEIHYYGFMRPAYRDFNKNDGCKWRAQVIDTWDMTITDAGTFEGSFRIALPGKEYMAIRLIKE